MARKESVQRADKWLVSNIVPGRCCHKLTVLMVVDTLGPSKTLKWYIAVAYFASFDLFFL
jgi:hypothetical protein